MGSGGKGDEESQGASSTPGVNILTKHQIFCPDALKKPIILPKHFSETKSYSRAKPEIYFYDRVDFWSVVTKSKAFLYSTLVIPTELEMF